MADAKLEPFEFGRGWTLDKFVIEMVEPRYMPLNGYAEAWSPSTKGELVGRAGVRRPGVGRGRHGDERRALPAASSCPSRWSRPSCARTGVQPTTTTPRSRPGAPAMPRQPNPNQADARQITQLIREAGAGVLIRTSAGEHGTVFVLGRDQARDADAVSGPGRGALQHDRAHGRSAACRSSCA